MSVNNFSAMGLSGDAIFPLIAGTALFGLLSFFIIFFVVLYRKAQLKFQLERRELNDALLQTQIEIREQTLTDISHELHDNLGQIASLIKIHLNTISTPSNQKDMVKLNESRTLLGKMIQDIRSISTSLNSSRIENMNLVEMMQLDVERINSSGYLNIHLKTDDLDFLLPADKAVFLYRMFQEMLNNIIKHARATEVNVELNVKNQQLLLKVNDNGIGTAINPETTNGNGLSNIRERCRIIGAKFNFTSTPGTGTKISINLPIAKNA